MRADAGAGGVGTALPLELARALSSVRSAGIITGAGISAESGIPTYRGQGGLYDDPAHGDSVVEGLTGTTFQRDPDRTWRTVAELATRARGARPNAGHLALVEIERRLERCVLLTQNVDGLHGQAGSRNVIDIHGDVSATLCTRCGLRGRLESPDGITSAPRCPRCDGVLRPDVVLFGELLPVEKAHRIYREFHISPPDLVLVVGTTALFPYICEPVVLAREHGRLTVEINPEATPLSGLVSHSLRGRAGDFLPAIAAALPERAGREASAV